MTPSGRDIEADTILAGHLADTARKAILPYLHTVTGLEGKTGGRPGFDPVTAADRDAEKAIRDLLAGERPLDGITGEEFGETSSQSGWRWYIDPIDGTRAFVAGFPVWTTLISLVGPDGEACIGLIDQPLLAERYTGTPAGSYLQTPGGSRRLRVSGQQDLRLATIATTDPFILTPAEQGAWNHLRATARIARYGADAYAYARLAAGSTDLVAETGLQPWDVAALIPVIRGAGGLVTDWKGNPARLGGQIVAAASRALLDEALIALKRAAS